VPRQGPLRRSGSMRGRGAEFAIIKPGQSAIFAPGRLTKLGDLAIPLTPNEAWQRDAYGFAEVIGELGYLIELTSDAISSCVIRTQERDLANDFGWVDTADEKVNSIWDAFVGPQGGKKELIKRASEHLYTAGESYLVGTPIKNELTGVDEGIVWEFLSTEELKPSGNKIQRIGETGSGGRVDLPKETYVARLWQPDPRFYHRAYSAVKRLLPICVAEGELVSTDLGLVAIQDVSVGDEVWAWDGGRAVLSPVSAVTANGDKPVLKVQAGVYTVRATADHRILATQHVVGDGGIVPSDDVQWVQVQELTGDHCIVTADEGAVGDGFAVTRVQSVEPDGVAPVWDLTVPGPANFIVQGVVVHNCREIVLLTQVVDAIAKGRLNAGIYYLPDEFSFGSFDETENDGADTDEIDEFSEEWIDQIKAPVEDRTSAASLIPLLMRGPAMIDGKPAKDLMGLVDLARGLDTLYQSLRQEALQRLATGMDAPPEVIGGKGGLNHWCCDDKTEVLTTDGWKGIDEFEVGDILLSLNHETGATEWRPSTDVYRADVVDLPMLSIEGDRHSSLTTMDHRWPTLHKIRENVTDVDGRTTSRVVGQDRIWTTSEELNSNDSLLVAAPSSDRPKEMKWSDELVEVLAWLWTEGNIRFKNRDQSPQVSICQSNKVNPFHVERIRNSLTLLLGNAKEHLTDGHVGRPTGGRRDPAWAEQIRPERPDMTDFRLNASAADLLVPFFSDPERKVLDLGFIHDLTASQIELFIDVSVRADGTVLSAGTMHITQSERDRLAPLELAAILSGRSTHIYETKQNGTMLSISRKTTFGLGRKEMSVESYTGTIWCPTVPPHHSVMIRRSGKVVYTGQTSYNIDADFIDKHIVPKGQKIAEFLTVAYLRPMLITCESMTEEKAARYRLNFDATLLTSRTDTGPAARGAYDRIAIKEASYLRANGFDVSDAPDEEERKRRTLEKLMFSEPILWGTRVIGELYPDLGDIFTPEDLTSPGNEARQRGQGPRAGDGGTDVDIPDSDTGQQVPEARGPSIPGGGGEAALLERLQTAADAALKRAIERASNRIISRLNGTDLPVKDEIRKHDKYEMLSVLSENDYSVMNLHKEDLMRDAWVNLEVDVTAWVREYFIVKGENPFMADERAKAASQYLSVVLTAHMATAFIKPIRTGVNGLSVPTGFVVGSLEKAYEVDVDPYQNND